MSCILEGIFYGHVHGCWDLSNALVMIVHGDMLRCDMNIANEQ